MEIEQILNRLQNLGTTASQLGSIRTSGTEHDDAMPSGSPVLIPSRRGVSTVIDRRTADVISSFVRGSDIHHLEHKEPDVCDETGLATTTNQSLRNIRQHGMRAVDACINSLRCVLPSAEAMPPLEQYKDTNVRQVIDKLKALLDYFPSIHITQVEWHANWYVVFESLSMSLENSSYALPRGHCKLCGMDEDSTEITLWSLHSIEDGSDEPHDACLDCLLKTYYSSSDATHKSNGLCPFCRVPWKLESVRQQMELLLKRKQDN